MKKRKLKKVNPPANDQAALPRVALRPGQFAAALSISRALLYTLPVQPRSVKLGGARVILESPEAYLQRVEAQQAAAA
jgi:hypothetical protein